MGDQISALGAALLAAAQLGRLRPAFSIDLSFVNLHDPHAVSQFAAQIRHLITPIWVFDQ